MGKNPRRGYLNLRQVITNYLILMLLVWKTSSCEVGGYKKKAQNKTWEIYYNKNNREEANGSVQCQFSKKENTIQKGVY
jgi:hypothetical protein